MLNIAFDKVRPFVDSSKLKYALKEAETALELLKKHESENRDGLGWRRVARNQDEELLNKIQNVAREVQEDADVFIICGIGGSYLGSRAVIDALSPYFDTDESPEILFAGHHLSGSYLENMIQYLEQPKADGSKKSVYLNVISKSGSTLETAVAFRVLRNWVHKHFDDFSDRILCTTSEQGGVLNEIIDRYGYRKFVIPADIGGRFSVLTPVGLLPIAVAGYNINRLMEGARQEYEKNENTPEIVLEYASLRRLLYEDHHKKLDLLTTFEPKLHSLSRWLQQLFAESEGKQDKGLFPATATYSTDLHSLGQMVQEGERNMIETFLTIREPLTNFRIGQNASSEVVSYLNDKSFDDISRSAFKGTQDAHYQGEVPIFSVALETLNEKSLGHYIYFYELLTAVYGYTLNINPFNQPGVEEYKNNMYQRLGKNKFFHSDA